MARSLVLTLRNATLGVAGLALAACSSTPMQSRGGFIATPDPRQTIDAGAQTVMRGRAETGPESFPRWIDQDPVYRFFPGDQIEVIVYSAPELNRTLTVGPDGRVFFPLAGAVMAADRTPNDLRLELMNRLSSQLIDTNLDVSPSGFASQQIFVAGEVASPGLYTMPGPIDALQAVIMAGGVQTTAKTKNVVIIRRDRGGVARRLVVDIEGDIRKRNAGSVALQRFDVVFVPRSTIAEVNLFVSQYFRDLIGFNVGFSYVFNDDGDNDAILTSDLGGPTSN